MSYTPSHPDLMASMLTGLVFHRGQPVFPLAVFRHSKQLADPTTIKRTRPYEPAHSEWANKILLAESRKRRGEAAPQPVAVRAAEPVTPAPAPPVKFNPAAPARRRGTFRLS